MPRSLIALIIAFSCSCTNATAADTKYLKKEVAYATIANSEIKHTKHVKKQQQKVTIMLLRLRGYEYAATTPQYRRRHSAS